MTLRSICRSTALDRNIVDAGGGSRGGAVRTFLRVVLPLSMPGVLSGCVMVFSSPAAPTSPRSFSRHVGMMFGNVIARNTRLRTTGRSGQLCPSFSSSPYFFASS